MNRTKHSLTYSLAAIFVVIAYSLGIYLAGITNSMLNNVSYVFYIGILVYALKNYREKVNNNYMTFGQAMGYSTLFALWYCIAMAIWAYVFMSYIAPGLMESEMMKQQGLMEAKGMPPEQVEMAMKYARMFAKPPVVAILALVGGMLVNTIINLIISAIMKKDPPMNFDDQNPPINTSAY